MTQQMGIGASPDTWTDSQQFRTYDSTREVPRSAQPTVKFRNECLPASGFLRLAQPWMPWTLYLPGICVHSVTEDNRENPLHLRSAKQKARHLKYQPFHLGEPTQELRLPLEEHPFFRSTSADHHLAGVKSSGPDLPIFSAQPASSNLLLETVNSAETATNRNKQAFENTSTSVAASQMRNALNNLADTVTDAEDKKVRGNILIKCLAYVDNPYSSSRPRWTTSLLFSEDT
jgi:hypothetical protein